MWDTVLKFIYGERPDPADEPFTREVEAVHQMLSEVERRQESLRQRVKAHRGHG